MVCNIIDDHPSNHADMDNVTDLFCASLHPIEHNMCMELPQGIKTKHVKSNDYVLKHITVLYG